MKLKEYTNNKYTNIYANAASQVGCTIKVLDKEIGYVIATYKDKQLKIIQNVLSLNSYTNAKLASNKYLSSLILRPKLGKLIPPSILINLNDIDSKKLHHFIDKYRQIVLKRVSGSGGKGILVLPKDDNAINEHFEMLRDQNKTHALVEVYSPAKHEYRFVSYEGQIIDIMGRIPAHIIGDGKSTIEELIMRKNQEKENLNANEIVIDENFLKGHNLSQTSIPKLGQTIYLNQMCNLQLGGDPIIYDLNKTHEKYQHIAKTIYDLTHFKLIGIDIMSDDLTEDPYSNNTIINEINAAPMPGGAYLSRIDTDDPLITVKIIFRKFFDISD